MANVLNPQLLRRGFLAFMAISLLGFVGILIHSDNLSGFIASLGQSTGSGSWWESAWPRWTGSEADSGTGWSSAMSIPIRRWAG
jgi:hypothetical protein